MVVQMRPIITLCRVDMQKTRSF